MRLFTCSRCAHPVYFENLRCEACGAVLGFRPSRVDIAAFEVTADGPWPAVPAGPEAAPCANRPRGHCNWMVEDAAGPFCRACRFNRTIPNLAEPGNAVRWQRIEAAKRRLVYGLIRFGLEPAPWTRDPHGLAFDFLAEQAGGAPVLTGHAAGVVTINVAEADPVAQTIMREQMAELYRTLLGHFRHEVGHLYWERLVRDGDRLEAFRALFGDERSDYQAALARHYAQGPAPDWNDRHISAYAAVHPWEDWAETWAHYLHIVDTLETARAYGLAVTPVAPTAPDLDTDALVDAYAAPTLDALIDAWLPLVFAVNSLNRSMGLGDLYPFVLGAPVREKLRFVHHCVRSTS